jgi:serine/threonine protein kinase
MNCPICGEAHASDVPCSTIVRRGSGTAEMLPWDESAQIAAEITLADEAQPAAPMSGVDPMIGATIGSFRIVRMIGKGGMGTVYLGEQTVIGSKVAIKILHDHLASNASLVSRFYAEARAVNLIGHENIVNIFDMNVVPPNRYYLIMELLEGRPLNTLIKGPLAPEVVVPILAQVCDALDAAHARGVVHRDLKPENIFLIRRGRNENFAKILDFGIAKLFATEAGTEQTAAGMIVGTPEYMAPEQCTGEKIDGRADIYALGVIAYLLVTGRLPFSGGGLTGLLIAHQTKIATPPHQVNPSVPLELSATIMRALAKKVEDRFQTAGDLAAALEFAVPPAPSTGRGPITVTTPPHGAQIARPSIQTPSTQTPSTQTPSTQTPSTQTPSAQTPSAQTPSTQTPSIPVPQITAPVPPPRPPAPSPPRAQLPSPLPATPRVSTPEPVHARHAASFDAKVTTVTGAPLGALKCQDISKGGCFLCTDGAVPPIFSKVKVGFPIAGDLECLGEVVRHVTRDQATAWGMSPGFGVQFVTLTPEQKDALGRVVAGLPAHKAAEPPKSSSDDRLAEQVLASYRKRINGDHYVVLGLELDVELSEVRARGRDTKRELEALRTRPISNEQKAQLDAALAKVASAVETLGSAQSRIAFDAQRGNFKGVARCIAAGLTVTTLEATRASFLSGHPGAESKSQVKFVSGNAYENNNQLTKAVESYEEALALDPLNLRYQQRYWALKRRYHP